jgi:hypothetical protein
MAERKFTPGYKANPNSTKAGSYSPFHVLITKKDGEQELKVVDVTLPKGSDRQARRHPLLPGGRDCGGRQQERCGRAREPELL